MHVSYIWYVWIVCKSIWLLYDRYMLWYVNDMITLTVWNDQWYVWDRIWEWCDICNVTIELRYVHKTLWLGYVKKMICYDKLIKRYDNVMYRKRYDYDRYTIRLCIENDMIMIDW